MARALLIGERIDTSGLERSDVVSTTPLAFRSGQDGLVVIFRYGAVATVGLTPLEEDEVLRSLGERVVRPFSEREEETAAIEFSDEREDQIPPGGPIYLKRRDPERILLIADSLAKSVALARDEAQVDDVFDVIDPLARTLAETGGSPGRRSVILRHVGHALLVRHRVSGRVAVEEKPDVLWDRPDLERLYARLEDEYELKERVAALHRKLEVIGGTTTALTDLIDTRRSLRLEAVIVALITFEIAITIFQMMTGR
ncbi:RMD1 family protein [uncultured Enterovirga sp.]|uniref:RMD1 family protein n=1 Tax=uncultured Enterovirga sp. TaxID=2026352 RepID=UPI0035CAA83B